MASGFSQGGSLSQIGRPFVRRGLAFLGLLVVEYGVIALRFDGLMHRYPGPWEELTALVTLATLGLTGVLVLYGRQTMAAITNELSIRGRLPALRRPMVVHGTGFLGLFAVAELLSAREWSAVAFGLAVGLLLLFSLCSVGGALFSLLSPRSVWDLARALQRPLLLGLAAGLLALASGLLVSQLWTSIAGLTLTLVAAVLRLFGGDVQVWPETRELGLDSFVVEVARECSGIEGMGLMVFFLGAYLWTARSRLRFPRALILLPLGLIAMYAANLLRIVALVLIGAHLSPEVALGGFHSKAGWVFFCAVALALLMLASRVRAIMAEPGDLGTAAAAPEVEAPASFVLSSHNDTAVFLLPLLSIIATYLVTGLFVVGPLDPFYGLRLLACALVLFAYRKPLLQLPRHSSIYGPLAGLGAFGLWMLLMPAPAQKAHDATGAALAALPDWGRAGWLVLRVCGAAVFVPVAEELAFRGFVYRRLVPATDVLSAWIRRLGHVTGGGPYADGDAEHGGPAARAAVEFSAVPFDRRSWPALMLSSVAFGALHSQYVAGTVVGLLYGLVMVRRGSLLDAIIAHGVTNALLSGYVLASGDWAYW